MVDAAYYRISDFNLVSRYPTLTSRPSLFLGKAERMSLRKGEREVVIEKGERRGRLTL